jgi:branched-chain amino acid transport system ATP-binding protein
MLALRQINAGYGDTMVLRGVELAVPDSSVVALIGPNGAGKSTLLRTAAGLLRPKAGRVLFGDTDVTSSPPECRARLGLAYVPEGRGIFRSLTVRQNLRLQAVSVSEAEALERAAEAFPILGRRLGQLAGTLSGGEQQMLALARAYVEEPRFVLLDEVSMGLAPVIVDEIFVFLEHLARRGTGLLLVEQYVTRALELADYVFLLNRGEVVFSGEPAELDEQDLFADYVGVAG